MVKIKIFFLKIILRLLYWKIQKLTKKKFSLRMKSVELGQKLQKTVTRLGDLGVQNPKEIIIGERPDTGEIK